jgi:hypothetical protein
LLSSRLVCPVVQASRKRRRKREKVAVMWVKGAWREGVGQTPQTPSPSCL